MAHAQPSTGGSSSGSALDQYLSNYDKLGLNRPTSVVLGGSSAALQNSARSPQPEDNPTWVNGVTKTPGVAATGSTGTMGGGYGSGGGAGSSASSYYAAIQQLYDAQRARENELAAQLQARAQSAYDTNMGALTNAYSQRADSLRGNYDSVLSDIQGSYDFGAGSVNSNADRALRDAYINMMMNRRDMPQLLSAQGISGGLSESALANIRSQYGGARNELELARGSSLDELLNALQQNQGEASRQYNSQIAADDLNRMNYEMQLKNNLENRVSDILTNQYSNIANLDNAYTQQMAGLAQAASKAASGAASASSGLAAGNQGAYYTLKQAESHFGNGATSPNVLQSLVAGGYDPVTLMQIMGAQGYSSDWIGQAFADAGITQ